MNHFKSDGTGWKSPKMTADTSRCYSKMFSSVNISYYVSYNPINLRVVHFCALNFENYCITTVTLRAVRSKQSPYELIQKESGSGREISGGFLGLFPLCQHFQVFGQKWPWKAILFIKGQELFKASWGLAKIWSKAQRPKSRRIYRP